MTYPAPTAGPDLRALYALFPPGDHEPEYEFVPPDEVPPPYHGLLVHEHHMTVTVEEFHGEAVDVRVLAKNRTGNSYARKILLVTQQTRRVVQFGIVRINFDYTSAAVRAAIEAEDTPLGRILIEHNVLRRIEPTGFVRVIPGKAMMEWFGLGRPQPTYGRLAYIHCDNQPAVELLEVVAPE
jgi:chorismate-pyruvate lyase